MYLGSNVEMDHANQTTKALISEVVANKLDINGILASSNSFNIANLGSTMGFQAIDNIVESVKQKLHDDERDEVQFQVFFNDYVIKDFNTLFKSLPLNRQYFAAGVPGLIHGRLFPKATIHFVNSPYSLHWLSKVPDELVDRESCAFNKGKIFYTNARSEVVEAYAAQFGKDMEAFLNARAEELISGGLMALLVPCFEVNTNPLSHLPLSGVVDLLGDCLFDMVNMGLLSEDKVDSFNFPRYNATPKEIENIINKNGHFSIEKIQKLGRPASLHKAPSIHIFMLHLQASWEGLIESHFGRGIIDEVFDLLRKKIVTSSVLAEANMNSVTECFMILQRKAN